jgi:ABC-type xylose transport system substrate-binding protein
MVQATPVPYDRIEPIAVDLDNIDAVIIDSGFHDASDVYRNMPVQAEPSQS